MKKKRFILLAVLSVLLSACSSNNEEIVDIKSGKYSKMEVVGVLHNNTMTSVLNKMKSRPNSMPTDDYEAKLNYVAKITKSSIEEVIDFDMKSNQVLKYKYFLDSDAFCSKIISHKNYTRGEKNVEAIIDKMTKAYDSECLYLDSLPCIDEMIYALKEKNIISNKAAVILQNVQNLICRSTEGTISDAEFQRQIHKNWETLDAANFDEKSLDGAGIAAVLYATEASFEWWNENQNDLSLEGKVAPMVALDGAGAAVGLLLHCGKHWYDKLVWQDVLYDVGSAAIYTSVGGFKFVK